MAVRAIAKVSFLWGHPDGTVSVYLQAIYLPTGASNTVVVPNITPTLALTFDAELAAAVKSALNIGALDTVLMVGSGIL